MPNIPVYNRTQIPSGETTAVKVPFSLAQTGEEQQWQGMERLGAGLNRLADVMAELKMRQDKIKADREIIKGKATLDDFDNKTLQNLRETPVPTGENNPEAFYNNIIEERRKARAKIAEGIPTSGYSKDVLGNYAVSSDVEFTLKANGEAWAKVKDHSRAVGFTAAQDAVKNGDSKRAEEIYKTLMANGTIDEEDGKKSLANIGHDIDWAQAEKLAYFKPQELLKNIEDLKNYPNLMPDERTTLIRIAMQKSDIASEQVKTQILTNMLNMDKDPNIVRDVEADKMIKNILDESAMSGENKKTWIDTVNQWRAKPFTDDPSIEADTRLKVLNNQISGQEIDGRIGKGLSVETAVKLKQTLNTLTGKTWGDALAEADRTTGRVICPLRDEKDLFELIHITTDQKEKDLITDKRTWQLLHLDMYNREMNEWVDIHKNEPDAGKKFADYSEKQKYTYLNRSLDQIKELIKQRQLDLTQGTREVPKRKPNESIDEYIKRTGLK